MRLRFYLWLLAFLVHYGLPYGWLVRLTPLRMQIVVIQLVATCDRLGINPVELVNDMNRTLKRMDKS